jgi:hypothetical protein
MKKGKRVFNVRIRVNILEYDELKSMHERSAPRKPFARFMREKLLGKEK